ncbi:hypothetical protein [Shewanella sp.]|uniref:hypothetical protein n=1 Tax=Shewanella sp. TaxID=50422 RepID=UPI003D13EFE6
MINGLVTAIALATSLSTANITTEEVSNAFDMGVQNTEQLAVTGYPHVKFKPVEVAGYPHVRFKPLEVAGYPHVRFKPLELAGYPHVKFKPIEVAGYPFVKFINSAVA